MDVRNEDGNDLRTLLSDYPRALQVVAVAVLALGVGYALTYYGGIIFDHGFDSGGWGIASSTFYIVNSAVYAPAVLLGFVALLLVRYDERRAQAIKMTRLIMIAALLLVLSGLGEAVCLVGQFFSDESSMMSGWYVASQAFSFMVSVLFEGGVLVGLVYLFRQHERKHAARRSSGDEMQSAELRDANAV